MALAPQKFGNALTDIHIASVIKDVHCGPNF